MPTYGWAKEFSQVFTLTHIVPKLLGTLFKGYKAILATVTQWAYSKRRACCWIGEWVILLGNSDAFEIHFAAFLLWAGWPLAVPPIFRFYWLYFGSGPLTIFLIWIGVKVVKKNWRETQPKVGLEGIKLISIMGEFPDSGVLTTNLFSQF